MSVTLIARSIGVPYETTRRHVSLLVAENMCVPDGRRGKFIREHALLTPEMETAYREGFAPASTGW